MNTPNKDQVEAALATLVQVASELPASALLARLSRDREILASYGLAYCDCGNYDPTRRPTSSIPYPHEIGCAGCTSEGFSPPKL